MTLLLEELSSLQNECQSAHGEDGPHDAAEFRHCRDLVSKWMWKAKDAMAVYTARKGKYTGRQTYSWSDGATSRKIRDGSNVFTQESDANFSEAHSSFEQARSLLGQMRADCWDRLKVELDDL